MPLSEVLAQPFVAPLLPLLLERHKEGIELIRSRSEERDGTIFFDISDRPLEGYNKFIPYYLHPKATYSIGLSKSSFRTKVSVGSNPWTKADPAKMVNLAKVCERYGGGGHARVGAYQLSAGPGGQGTRSGSRDRGGVAVEESDGVAGSPETWPCKSTTSWIEVHAIIWIVFADFKQGHSKEI